MNTVLYYSSNLNEHPLPICHIFYVVTCYITNNPLQKLQIAEVFVGGTFWTQTLTATAKLSGLVTADDGKGLYVEAKSVNHTTSYDSPAASVAILGKSCGILGSTRQLQEVI